MMKNISINAQKISSFINNNSVLVDKSQQILNLFNKSEGPYFLSRPRRFGKSLLLDTLKNIALGNKKLFSSLEIGQADCNYDWRSYPVIHINMSVLDVRPNFFSDKLIDRLNIIAKINHLDLCPFDSPSDIYKLIEALSIRNKSLNLSPNQDSDLDDFLNIVLLIDEYDYPIINNIGKTKDEITLITDTLHTFYTAIKGASDFLRFTFITGVTKFSQLSLFSAMNTLQDITLVSDYASICGFTEEETKIYFSENLQFVLEQLISRNFLNSNTSLDDLMAMIVDYYDGYSWDGKIRVLNPYSVSNFLFYKSFGNYWIQSGESLLVSKLNVKNDIYFRSFADSCDINATLPISDVGNLDGPSIMLQTGYLTVKKIIPSGLSQKYILKTPNTEVANSLVNEYILKKLSSPDNPLQIDQKYANFYDAFINRQQDVCEVLFSSFLAEIPSIIYHRIEFVPQILLYTFLNIYRYKALLEIYVGEGRADIIFTPDDNTRFIIELKYRNEKNTAINNVAYFEEDIDRAHTQMLLKNYALPFIGRTSNIYMVAVAVQGQTDVKMSFRDFDLSDYKVQESNIALETK
jgi:hypothetical protein